MRGGRVAKDLSASLVGAVLATVWLVSLTVVDVLAPGHTIVLTPLFGLAPLIACAVLTALPTAGFGAAAVALAVASSTWDKYWGPQQVVRVIDVTLVSAAAVLVAFVRVRREQHLARVEVIAEVAQRAILPTLPKAAGRVLIGARYVSAAKDAVVGGDLYDYFHTDGMTRFLVGDVRGKGIAAVEQAARVIRAFRQSAPGHADLAGVARDMSTYLAPYFDDEEFVTALLVDASAPEQLTLVSCGHPPAVLVGPDGRADFVQTPPGLPLGLGEAYEAETVPWRPGQRLLMYTDGVSEARDAHGQFLPVLAVAPGLASGTVDEALDELLQAIRRHVPHGDLDDDLAVILLEHVAREQPVPGRAPSLAAEEAASRPTLR